MILLFSLLTFGVYYVVYHFQVNSELRRMRRWQNDDLYKPSLFFFMYLALTILWVLSFILGITVAVKEIARALSLESALFNSDWTRIESFSQLYGMFVSFVGLPVTIYFLKLNQYAAEKTGAVPRSVVGATVSYTLFVGLSITFGVLTLMSYFAPEDMIVDGIENLSRDDLIKVLMYAGGLIFFAFLQFAMGLIFLWKQTELVNYVWEAGHFSNPESPGPTSAIT